MRLINQYLHYIRPTICECEQSCPANNSSFTPLRVHHWLLWILIFLKISRKSYKIGCRTACHLVEKEVVQMKSYFYAVSFKKWNSNYRHLQVHTSIWVRCRAVKEFASSSILQTRNRTHTLKDSTFHQDTQPHSESRPVFHSLTDVLHANVDQGCICQIFTGGVRVSTG